MRIIFKQVLAMSVAVTAPTFAADNTKLSAVHASKAIERFAKIEDLLVRMENSRREFQHALDANSAAPGQHKAPYYQDFDKLLEGTTRLWDGCLQGSATEFARNTSESAEAIATASFVKCKAGERLLPKIYMYLARSREMSMDLPRASKIVEDIIDSRREFLIGFVVEARAEQKNGSQNSSRK